MRRNTVCVILAVLLQAGSGCSVLKQSDTVTTAVPLPEKTTAPIKLPAATQADVDPERMTLHVKEWSWIRTVYNNDKVIVPAKPGVFTLTFDNEGIVNVGTDCNRMRGSYSVEGRLLTIGDLAATRMYCANSQETEFATMLAQVSAFLFSDKGELVLEMKFDTGVILFE